MSLPEEAATVVTMSAPGKILIAGGYLVLKAPNVGVVVAADKRFHATVTTLAEPHSVQDDEDDNGENLRKEFAHNSFVDVHSPQYDAVFSYRLWYNPVRTGDVDSGPLLKLVARGKNGPRNTFVETTLVLVLSYIMVDHATSSSDSSEEVNQMFPNVLGVKLRADNDFYSQVDALKERGTFPATPADVEALPEFLPAGSHKTGMGSSAALVTSTVAAMLKYFLGKSHESATNGSDDTAVDDLFLEVVHNLAQAAHSLAQGKIGSGFDVSAAVYGSHVYSRFNQVLVEPLFSRMPSSPGDVVPIRLARALHRCVHGTWDAQREPVDLGRLGLEILMADVCGGSESPSMARKVLAWHKDYLAGRSSSQNDHDDDYWEQLRCLNAEIPTILSGENEGGNDANVEALRTALAQSRRLLRSMGEAAGVPVEPPEQTALADATAAVQGVVAAGVPGAGGYDALYCLYQGGEDVRARVAELWGRWEGADNEKSATVVSPMAVRAVGWKEGLRQSSHLVW